MVRAVSKYELWNALFAVPDKEKSDNLKELEKLLNDTMSKPGMVFIDVRQEW